MFSTPPSASAGSRRETARRLVTAVGRLNSARNQTSVATDDAEPPIPSEGESNAEVLTILRSLQQQVSALQAQQQATQVQVEASPRCSGGSTSSTPNSTKRKLPKELVSTVHQTIRNFRDRDDNPLEWNTSSCFSSQHNSQVTAEIINTLANENFSASMVRRAARTYFITLQRRSKRMSSGNYNLSDSQKKQRKLQRKHTKLRHRRSVCLASTSLSQEEKERSMKILMLEFMFSEETGTDSGSGSETTKVFLTKPIPWRSQAANNVMESLDRKIVRRRSERAKEMCRARRIGQPSSRPMPTSHDSSWAVFGED